MSNSIRGGRRKRGFTLIEVLVAGLIISIGIAATAGLMPFITKFETLARLKVRSSILASSRVDYLLAQTFDDIVATSSTQDFTDILPTDLGGTRTATWAYTSTETITNQLKRVDMRITVASGGSSSSDSYVFYIADWNDDES